MVGYVVHIFTEYKLMGDSVKSSYKFIKEFAYEHFILKQIILMGKACALSFLVNTINLLFFYFSQYDLLS